MTNVPITQILVAGSSLLAALPVGCSVNYPSVLLQQLTANDTTIHLDWDTASWIGSIHGIAAVPSILMPAFMQWRGRKMAFMLACLVSIVGWIVAFTANSATNILISESLLGFGSQSIMAVGLLSMSEMLSPQTRNVTMSFYLVVQSLGMALAGILGNYLHWRTVTLVVCAPLVVTTGSIFLWPESPSWLAYKGEFDESAKAFKRLRGTGELAQLELEELFLAQKERLANEKSAKKEVFPKRLWQTLKSRDFYLPALHIFVVLCSIYWIGGLVIVIYSSVVIPKATFTNDSILFGNLVLNIMMFLGCVASVSLLRFVQPKKVLLGSSSCSVLFLLIGSGVNFFQTSGILTKKTYMCLYMLSCSIFTMNLCTPIVMAVAAELMPVKHRGIGGPLFSITSCFLHTTTLKIGPYLLKNMSFWGLLLVFAANGFFCNFCIWKFVPETKKKTLQQLEDYYAYGKLHKRRCLNRRASIEKICPISNNLS